MTTQYYVSNSNITYRKKKNILLPCIFVISDSEAISVSLTISVKEQKEKESNIP